MGAKAEFSGGEVVIGGSLMHAAKPDFSGYATKAGLKCSDGRTIMPDAFKHQDKVTVPLVWQHNYNEPANVLGHAVLENRKDGVYCYGYFNGTEQATHAKTLVEHKDISSLSIYANQLTEKAKQVFHGFIKEVSLVLAGANPGALIDNVTLAHADGDMVTLEDEAVIYTGLDLEHADGPVEDDPEDVADAGADEATEDGNPTVQQVYDSMTSEQKEVVHYMVGAALEDAKQNLPTATHSEDDESSDDTDNDEKKGRSMSRNVFEQENDDATKGDKTSLTHDDMKGIFEDAQRLGSLKEAVEGYALKHGIDNIDVLFPEVRNITDTPEFLSRRIEWVAGVIDGTRKTPFTRIKQIVADITYDEARARGYIKGTMKKEEYFSVSRRTTLPTTIYKKQKLDRDDILDITDFDVVVWLKAEMRLMLDEELARAILIGDGRAPDSEDKVKDPAGQVDGIGIRSIKNEHELYAAQVNVNVSDANSSPTEIVDVIISNMRYYKGSGNPTLYTTLPNLTYMLLARDTLGRRLYRTASDLAAELGVSAIVPVEVMESEPDLFGIIVNLTDYTIGTDKGGEVNFFDFFDIDYNQYKYLLETRCTGALTKIRSALVINKMAAGDALLAAPTEPTFDPATGNITIVDDPNVTYRRADTNAVVTAASSPIAVPDGQTLEITATPNAGYFFETNATSQWDFTNEPG